MANATAAAAFPDCSVVSRLLSWQELNEAVANFIHFSLTGGMLAEKKHFSLSRQTAAVPFYPLIGCTETLLRTSCLHKCFLIRHRHGTEKPLIIDFFYASSFAPL